jgi:hypothetical protein
MATIQASFANAVELFNSLLGLEMGLSHVTMPELELVARLHHRSGAWGTLSRGDHEGYNAWISGIRYRF